MSRRSKSARAYSAAVQVDLPVINITALVNLQVIDIAVSSAFSEGGNARIKSIISIWNGTGGELIG